MANRDSIVKVRFTPEELAMVREKMAQYGTDNLSAFVRKMCIDGYMVKLDFPELKEMVSLRKCCSANAICIGKQMVGAAFPKSDAVRWQSKICQRIHVTLDNRPLHKLLK